MQKIDITNRCDNELTLMLINDEGTYQLLQMDSFERLKDYVDALYIYTPEQLEDLRETYNEMNEGDV